MVRVNVKEIERRIHRYANRERRKRRMQALKSNYGLTKTARKHSGRMARRRKLWHGEGVNLAPRVITYPKGFKGFLMRLFTFHKYTRGGENCHCMPLGRIKGFRKSIRTAKDIARAMHRGWMRSPGHRANILNSDFSLIGVGVKRRGNNFYATQLFYG